MNTIQIRGNNFECDKRVLALICVIMCFSFIYNIVMMFVRVPSQAGSEDPKSYARQKYAQRARDSRNARNRKFKKLSVPKIPKKTQAPRLDSQFGISDASKFVSDATQECTLDALSILWKRIRSIETPSLSKYIFELKMIVKQFFSDLDFSSFTDSTVFSTIFKNFKYIIKCDIFISLTRILAMLVTLGWLPTLEYEVFGVSLLKSVAMRHQISVSELVEEVGKLFSLILSALKNFPSQGFEAFYSDYHKIKYIDDVTMLMSKKVLLDVGRELDMDAHEYDRILEETISKTLELLGTCSGADKNTYSRHLKELKNLQSQRTLAQRDYIRMKPYGILLYGGSAVGKSAIANSVIRFVLETNDFDSSPRSIITLNEFDKFQSEYRTYHNGVIFDDLSNGTVDYTDGNPLMKVIQFINNAPQAALNPNVEMKGNVMIEPNVVLATTNVKDLNAKVYSNEPLSIARRFQITITQSVKPEFCQTGSKMIDSNKVRKAFGNDPYPDFANFTVETAIANEGAADPRAFIYVPIVYKGKPLTNIGIRELLAFLREDSRNHFENQRHFVDAQKSLEQIVLCEHGMPIAHCCECELDSQMFDFNKHLNTLLEFEEKIMSSLEYYLVCFFNTKYGNAILAVWCRQYLRENMLHYFKLLGFAVAFSLYTELISNIQCVFMLLCLITTISTYIGICVYIKRKTMIKKYTTLPRLSVYVRSLSYGARMRILASVGGISTLLMIIKLINKLREIPMSEASAPIKIISTGKQSFEEPPKWGSAGRAILEKQFKIDAGLDHDVKSMNPEKMYNSMIRRQMMLHIGEEGSAIFCNAVPLKNNIMLIPNHVVPKKTTFARLTRASMLPKHVYLQPESVYRIPSTDFALWYLPELGDQRDIVNYLPTDLEYGKKVTAFLMYNNCGEVVRFPKMLATRSNTRSTQGGNFESLTYSFPGKTFQGLCMATLIAEDLKGHPFIAGFHLAGKDSFGAAGFITKQQVIDGIAALNKKSSILSSHSGVPMRTELAGIEMGPLVKPHEKCVSNDLSSEAKCIVFGQHNQPRSSPSSTVVTSCISAAVTKYMNLPKLHGPPHKMSDRMHKEVDIVGKTDTAFMFQGDSIEKSYDDLLNQLLNGLSEKDLKSVGKLDLDNVLAGVDGVTGINSMEFSTSAGVPFRGKKTQFVVKSDRFVEGVSCPRDVDPLVLEEVEYMRSELAAGRRINTPFKAALKDEPTKTTKTKVRVFAGSNMPMTMLVREYFLTLSALMQDNKKLFECAVGLNVYSPEWTDLMKHIYKYGDDRIIAGDYKAFDTRMSPRFMLAAFKILITIAGKTGNYDEEDLMVMKGIAAEITNPTYDYFGTFVQFFGSNPSGHPLTVVINSLVNSLYMRYCYFEIAKEEKWWKVPAFKDVVSLMTYGDDNIMSVRKGYDAYNHSRVAQVLAKAGITYTMADKEAESVPFIKGSEAGFLKHDAIWDEELKLYRAVIDETSIQKTLHAHMKSDVLCEEAHSASAITDVLDKYFQFGRETYNVRRSQLEEVARECDILGYIGELLTYDEQLERYCKNYSWKIEPNV